jgi:hypothetical protein
MEAERKYEMTMEPVDVVPQTWDRKIARLVSDIISPPFLTLVGAGIFAMALNTKPGWLWSGIYVFVVNIIPTLYILWLVYRGKVSDFHLRVREERVRPYIVIVVCALSAALLMLLGPAPYPLKVISAVGILQMLTLLIVTTKWKISGHSMGISSFSVMVWALFGNTAAPVLLTIPLVVWARLHLQRHTFLQTLVGVITGAFFMGSALYLIAQNCGGLENLCR